MSRKEFTATSISHIQEYVLDNVDEFIGNEMVIVSFFFPGKEITYFEMKISKFMRGC